MLLNNIVMIFIVTLVALAFLLWSAERFIEGAIATAAHYKIPPLLIGMVIVGFGTSAPELLVSIIASTQGNPGIALGNAYGSNITNIGLIVGVAAIISPILVHSKIIRRELPLLIAVTLFTLYISWNGMISRGESLCLLIIFAAVMAWSIWQGLKNKRDSLANEFQHEIKSLHMPVKNALFWLLIGLVILTLSSRFLVWGAVAMAHWFHVSDIIIGLTIVAIGTSLPELATVIIAARKAEHDLILGNIIGSNLFNTLLVVGIAGMIAPIHVTSVIFVRDLFFMTFLTIFLFIVCYGFKGPGKITRIEGFSLVIIYLGYMVYLVMSAF